MDTLYEACQSRLIRGRKVGGEWRESLGVSRCTVARLMKGMGIQGVIRGKPHRTTITDKKAHARWTG